MSPFGIIKSRTAAVDVPLLHTLAHVPAAPVVVLQTQTVAAVPGFPWSHLSPLGIPKFSIAAQHVPLLLTVAQHPAASVVVDPTATVAAAPGTPWSHFSPFKLQYCAFFSLLQSWLSENKI